MRLIALETAYRCLKFVGRRHPFGVRVGLYSRQNGGSLYLAETIHECNRYVAQFRSLLCLPKEENNETVQA